MALVTGRAKGQGAQERTETSRKSNNSSGSQWISKGKDLGEFWIGVGTNTTVSISFVIGYGNVFKFKIFITAFVGKKAVQYCIPA